MTALAAINLFKTSPPPTGAARTQPARLAPAARTAPAVTDRVDIGLDVHNGTAPAPRIEQIRREIAAGTYLTPDRLEKALDGLLSDLRGKR